MSYKTRLNKVLESTMADKKAAKELIDRFSETHARIDTLEETVMAMLKELLERIDNVEASNSDSE